MFFRRTEVRGARNKLEVQLSAILERCHTAALDAGIPDSKVLPEGFSGTPARQLSGLFS